MRGDDIVAELRAVKRPEELELIRHAARLGDIGFQTMVDVARPGMRGIEIVAEMEHVVRKAAPTTPSTGWGPARHEVGRTPGSISARTCASFKRATS